jgi:predicted ATPase/DNA-binding SARP family transcriptional activator
MQEPTRVDVRILGPLEVLTAAGRRVPTGSPQQRAVLALLALTPGRVVPADRIADELWREELPLSAANVVQGYVLRLRRALGPGAIVTRAPGYLLELPPSAVDAVRFEELAAEGRRLLDDGDAETAAARLAEALALWRGRALADVAGVQACEREAARLEEQRVRTIEDSVEADLARGRHADVVPELEALAAEHPLRERLYAQRMLALYRAGRQAEALACYTDLRTKLAEELGVDPSPDLQRLEQAVLLQKPELDWTPPVPRMASAPERSVPEPLTTFVGRTAEVEEIGELLASARLVTLTGPGGAGKSRLAVETARNRALAWFVPLAEVADSATVAVHLARTLGVAETTGRRAEDAVAERLSPHECLLVLDNCEHVLEHAAGLAHHLLARCSRLRVLATSREPLRVAGEAVYRVRPLPVPPAGADPLGTPSVQLFVDRARAASGLFDAHAHADAVAAVCRRLDGIPLAIELAAARVDVLTPEEIHDRLDDALGLLATDARTEQAHHRTLRAALRWSYDALGERQRAVFRALAVFVGPFTLADAAAVLGEEVMDELSRLVSLSLVDATDAVRTKRFSLLETVRQFAWERLEEHAETGERRARHLVRFVDVAGACAARMAGPEQADAAAELDAQWTNLRAALQRALQDGTDPAGGVRLAASLVSYWQLRGHLDEARRWLEAAVDASGEGPDVQAVRLGLGAVAHLQGDLDRAGAVYAEALDAAVTAADDHTAARCRVNLGNLALLQGDLGRARQMLGNAAAAARLRGDDDLAARALTNLAQVVRRQGDLDAAREMYEEALEAGRRLGNPLIEVTARQNLGEIERISGDVETARSHLQDALDGARRLGFAAGVSAALGALGNLAHVDGDHDTARACFSESVEIARQMGNHGLQAAGVANLAIVAEDAGDLDEAWDRFQQYRTLCERTGDARAMARASRGLADVARQRGDHRRAARTLAAALAGTSEPDDVVTCLESAAALAAAGGERVLAGRLLGAARGARRALGTEEGRPVRSSALAKLDAGLEVEEIPVERAVADASAWLARAAVRPTARAREAAP